MLNPYPTALYSNRYVQNGYFVKYRSVKTFTEDNPTYHVQT